MSANLFYVQLPYNVKHATTGEVLRPGELVVSRSRGRWNLKALTPQRDRNVGKTVDVIDRPDGLLIVLDLNPTAVADYGYDSGGYYANPLAIPTRVGTQLIAVTFTPVATWPGATLTRQPDGVDLPPKPYVDTTPPPSRQDLSIPPLSPELARLRH